jgi:hypothetical protein
MLRRNRLPDAVQGALGVGSARRDRKRTRRASGGEQERAMTLEQAITMVQDWRTNDPRRFDAEAAERVFVITPQMVRVWGSTETIKNYGDRMGDGVWSKEMLLMHGAQKSYHSDPAADLESLEKVRGWEDDFPDPYQKVLLAICQQRAGLTTGPGYNLVFVLSDLEILLKYGAVGDYTAAALAVLLAKE